MADDEAQLVAAFRDAIANQWDRYEQLRREPFDLDVLTAIAKDAAEVAVGNLFWHLALGSDCLRAGDLSSYTGQKEQEVIQAVREGHLIGLEGRYATFLPRWQFDTPDSPKELSKTARTVLEIFREELGSLFRSEVVISWASTAQPGLAEQEPRDLMEDLENFEILQLSAQVAARRLAR
ncbi:hypothetical protein ABZV60_00530 [Streptomyces sp. NPDC004787]|uniref:hypothetical protein n=1 Tax=Streptomyces sp. NPDC004787 TaxID=3154291 RepID=UPI0033AAC82C